MALIKVREGRPATVEREGWIVHVSVHDEYYLREKKEWKEKRAKAHPDRGGEAEEFIKLDRSYQVWLYEEARWYAELGLLPPDGWQAPEIELKVEPSERPRALLGTWGLIGRLKQRRKKGSE